MPIGNVIGRRWQRWWHRQQASAWRRIGLQPGPCFSIWRQRCPDNDGLDGAWVWVCSQSHRRHRPAAWRIGRCLFGRIGRCKDYYQVSPRADDPAIKQIQLRQEVRRQRSMTALTAAAMRAAILDAIEQGAIKGILRRCALAAQRPEGHRRSWQRRKFQGVFEELKALILWAWPRWRHEAVRRTARDL